MADARDLIEALAATRVKFGPGPRRRKLELLDRLTAAPASRPRDLKACRDAILFIRPNDDSAEEASYSPAFVFPADPDNRGYLDQLAKRIRGIIEPGEQRNKD